ncbi:ATP-binding protein [Streptosporangium roseum]|uniref:Signal transduction histidine kinase regulating citrate/malate metabolism n=1 Tax=Streptosporangium roseum (strain ATCC 12428 / DSM 43021 / JCM 3005 / KCTC 9067 / NCIMB 10171 / NRRL 2505 / NI 9100) TaxID=479432 RepID=D2B336_STRRD|nr:ATP-binding protein [Streptosporangium roseum]ACZ85516.1 signal transduction histidine kinase regulating citrate/malate metabolism [Streptosporangium roseum DSM 43021]
MDSVVRPEEKDMDAGPEVLGEAFLKLEPTSAAQARGYISSWIGGDHPAYENVVLTTSELVTNAIVHSSRGRPHDLILLTLTRMADLLHLEVLDPGGTAWEPRPPEAVPDDGERGRGLAIVGEISRRRWGVHDHGPLGRTVWCDVDGIPAPAERPCG